MALQPPPLLREFEALVERAGGRERLLLVAEAPPPPPRALLEGFARDLFGEEAAVAAEKKGAPAPAAPAAGARRVRVRVGGGGRGRRPRHRPGDGPPPPPPCALLLVLVRAASLLPPRWGPGARRRLREILRDLRSRLRARPAVVGLAVLGEPTTTPPPPPGAPAACCKGGADAADAAAADDGEGAQEARARLEALLRRVFGARRRRRPEEPLLGTACYRPGAGAHEAREAACRALSAALQLRADEVAAEKQRLPAFLQCLPWRRPRQKSKEHVDTAADEFREDALQDADEGVALTNMTPNGKCEEAHGRPGS